MKINNIDINTFEDLVALAPADVKETLESLKGVRERPDYHPESSTYEHIKIVTERLLTIGDKDLVLAALYHDLGKLRTIKTNPKSGHIMTPGHEAISASFVIRDAKFIEELGGDVNNVYDIVANHMKIAQLPQMKSSKQNALRGLKMFNKLLVFAEADDMLNDFKF